jgi:pSer/pThr/pTyr-binding forkhead associated (FHA) protein
MPKLVVVGSGIVHDVPVEGLVIGRDSGCGILLDSREVSRRHATVGRIGDRCTITDESTNGVFVNGERAARSHVLSDGDVVRVGDVVFRFVCDSAEHADAIVPEPAEEPASARHGSGATTPLPEHREIAAPPAPLLATLEVLEGNVPHGMQFRIARPVAQLGRGSASDVCLLDDTVSGAHATLMLRGGTWYLLDHSSFNGTWVEGVRVSQCALPGTCEIRLGGVTLRFRPVAS